MNKVMIAFWVIVVPAGIMMAIYPSEVVNGQNSLFGGGVTRQNLGVFYLAVCLVMGSIGLKKNKVNKS